MNAEDTRIHDHVRHRALIARCRNLPPTRTAEVHPVDPLSIQGAVEAARIGLITPVLVGPEARIRAAAVEAVDNAEVWLASESSDYVVGNTLFIDGGMSLYPGFRGNG